MGINPQNLAHLPTPIGSVGRLIRENRRLGNLYCHCGPKHQPAVSAPHELPWPQEHAVVSFEPPRCYHGTYDPHGDGSTCTACTHPSPVLSHRQYQRLREGLPEDLRPVLMMGYIGHMNLNSAISLRWDQVDLANREVRTTTRKGRPLVIPLTHELVEMLQGQLKRRENERPDWPYVFFHSLECAQDFDKTWEQVCHAAGVPGFHFDDFRLNGTKNRREELKRLRQSWPDERSEEIPEWLNRIIESIESTDQGQPVEDALRVVNRFSPPPQQLSHSKRVLRIFSWIQNETKLKRTRRRFQDDRTKIRFRSPPYEIDVFMNDDERGWTVAILWLAIYGAERIIRIVEKEFKQSPDKAKADYLASVHSYAARLWFKCATLLTKERGEKADEVKARKICLVSACSHSDPAHLRIRHRGLHTFLPSRDGANDLGKGFQNRCFALCFSVCHHKEKTLREQAELAGALFQATMEGDREWANKFWDSATEGVYASRYKQRRHGARKDYGLGISPDDFTRGARGMAYIDFRRRLDGDKRIWSRLQEGCKTSECRINASLREEMEKSWAEEKKKEPIQGIAIKGRKSLRSFHSPYYPLYEDISTQNQSIFDYFGGKAQDLFGDLWLSQLWLRDRKETFIKEVEGWRRSVLMDLNVGTFLAEYFAHSPDVKVTEREIRAAYKQWHTDHGYTWHTALDARLDEPFLDYYRNHYKHRGIFKLNDYKCLYVLGDAAEEVRENLTPCTTPEQANGIFNQLRNSKEFDKTEDRIPDATEDEGDWEEERKILNSGPDMAALPRITATLLPTKMGIMRAFLGVAADEESRELARDLLRFPDSTLKERVERLGRRGIEITTSTVSRRLSKLRGSLKNTGLFNPQLDPSTCRLIDDIRRGLIGITTRTCQRRCPSCESFFGCLHVWRSLGLLSQWKPDPTALARHKAVRRAQREYGILEKSVIPQFEYRPGEDGSAVFSYPRDEEEIKGLIQWMRMPEGEHEAAGPWSQSVFIRLSKKQLPNFPATAWLRERLNGGTWVAISATELQKLNAAGVKVCLNPDPNRLASMDY